jgi:ribosomal protein S18 acetylase RimI-like enzyme
VALAKDAMVGMKPSHKILLKWGRRLARILPGSWGRVLDRGYDLLTKFEVVEMRRHDLNQLPPVRIPDGIVVSPLQPGREQDYIRVMRDSLKEDADAEWFRQNFSEDREYDPRNLILFYQDNKPVAAAAAWQYKYKNRTIGHIKSVGVIREYRGRGLGRQVSLVALHRLKDRGFDEVMLKATTSRIRAVELYFGLGFEPRYSVWVRKRKWRRLLSKIRRC